jgi:hypothetical protein
MKRILLVLLVAITFCETSKAQGIKTPQASPSTTIKQDFGISTIELNYSRPAIKGRQIFGNVVPFGKVWRTGANGATSITFGDDVIIGGKQLKAGKYGILSIPEANEWTIIITQQLDVTSAAAYKPEMDVVRVKLPVTSIPMPIESFTILLNNVQAASCELWILWDQSMVMLPITSDIDAKIMAQIKNQVINDTKPYATAAIYYLENGKDLNQALAWFEKATAGNTTQYWVWHNRAKCEAKIGKKDAAKASANKSLEIATAAHDDAYIKLNQDLLKTLN